MKYRRKPVEVEAFQWPGGIDQKEGPEWIKEASKRGEAPIISGDATVLTVRDSETNQLMFRCNLEEIEKYNIWK